MLDSRLRRDSQTATPPCAGGVARGAHGMPLLGGLFDPSSYPGYVGKDYEELLAVLFFMGVAMIMMVAFGAWWQR